MVQRLFARLDDLGVGPGRVIVAFSGGADSTGLAVGMAEVRRRGRVRPWLCHVAHGVREGSERDLPVLLRTAETLQLPISIRRVAPGAIASHVGCGLEEAMRRERYLALANMAAEVGVRHVLTAHHADDQAETVLAHLIRGAGLDGAAGMRPSTPVTVPWWPSDRSPREMVVVRPLLGERRRTLGQLAQRLEIEVVDDATNRDTDRTRAALRHRVLPELERISPSATEALARFAELAAAAAETRGRDDATDSRTLAISDMGGDSAGRQRGRLRRWIIHHAGRTPSLERIEAVRRLWTADQSGTIELGGGWSVVRRGPTIELVNDEGSDETT